MLNDDTFHFNPVFYFIEKNADHYLKFWENCHLFW